MVQLYGRYIPLSSVVDLHRFAADPDPNFHVDADPDPDPDWHKMMPILMRILPPASRMKITALPVFMFYLLHRCQKCHNFKYFGQHIEILRKKVPV